MSTVFIVTLIAVVVGIGSTLIFKEPPDNIVEETSEFVIEKELHLPEGSIDLTPKSPEQTSVPRGT